MMPKHVPSGREREASSRERPPQPLAPEVSSAGSGHLGHGADQEEGRHDQKFTSCEEHDARFQVDSRRRRPPTRWRDSELSRFRTTHTVHVVRTCILDRCTFSSTSSTQGCDFSVLCEVSLALKGNVTRKESWFDIITSISAFRRSNRGGRTCSTRKMRSVGSIANLI